MVRTTEREKEREREREREIEFNDLDIEQIKHRMLIKQKKKLYKW